MNQILEKYRFKGSLWGTKEGESFGLFFIPNKELKKLKVICSPMDAKEGWQHVSVSLPNRCPTWQEMSMIKNLFWGEEETVIQFHPKKSEHINNHPYCLHLWKKIGEEYELPPSILTGIKEG